MGNHWDSFPVFLLKMIFGLLAIGALVWLLGCETLPDVVKEEVRCSPVGATRCAGQVVQVCSEDGPWMMVSECLQQGPEWRCLEAPDKVHYCGRP